MSTTHEDFAAMIDRYYTVGNGQRVSVDGRPGTVIDSDGCEGYGHATRPCDFGQWCVKVQLDTGETGYVDRSTILKVAR